MKVYSCGQDHGTFVFDGRVICPCGYLAIDYDEWVAGGMKPVLPDTSARSMSGDSKE